jgi:Protein of unknown function (DUF3307)
MQLLIRSFLAIYLAHLLTDFVFQTSRLVERKKKGELGAFLTHGLIHYFSAILLLGFLVPGTLLSVRVHFVIVALTVAHLLLDFTKVRVVRSRLLRDGPWAYLSDQILHLLTVCVAAWLLSPVAPYGSLAGWLGQARNLHSRMLAVPVVYLAVVFGGGYLIRSLTSSLAEGAKTGMVEKSREQLQNAGLYIGWLERFLVVTALLLQSPATVGLILTAKSIARYPEFKSERFAEYFLIGTLLSLSIAILGGVFLAKLLLGHTGLPG